MRTALILHLKLKVFHFLRKIGFEKNSKIFTTEYWELFSNFKKIFMIYTIMGEFWNKTAISTKININKPK